MGNIDKFTKKIADDIALTKFSVYKTHAANKMISSVPELKTGESSTLFQKVGVKERKQLISISADFRSLIKELFSSLDNSFKMVMARSIEASQENINRARINFGRYLEHYKTKTQFLLITHKKKTMEYANTLYGITMQESGVSKLVSVKLEEIK